MSLQRTRPIDTLQRIMVSFKHFEKKLDKLQEDVDFHGNTLSELKAMLANLSAGTTMNSNINIDSLKRSVNNTAIQYEDRYHLEEPAKAKRKNPVQGFPSKIIAKSFQGQKFAVNPIKEVQYRINKVTSSPKNTGKHFIRHRKTDVLRKATNRAQKALEKNVVKVVN